MNIDLTNYSNEPPNLNIERKGCPFAYRCPLATDICREETPSLQDKGYLSEHLVACHHSD
jgi:oligopeptide/dipeptide ABC transporter ATP-binding protein